MLTNDYLKRWAALVVTVPLLHGCAEGARDTQPNGAKASYSVNAAELAGLCSAGKVTATLSINAGAAKEVAVDCASSLVAGQLANLDAGVHGFDLDLHRDGVWVVRRSASAELILDDSVVLTFGAPNFIDSDGDNYTNLAELNIYGLASNAWLNANLRPLVETPRFSTSYIMSDVVGEEFLVGSASSASYQATSNP